MNFAAYAARSTPCCSYLGPDVPPETCPRHGHAAMRPLNGKHYDTAEVAPGMPLGWADEQAPEQGELDFGGVA